MVRTMPDHFLPLITQENFELLESLSWDCVNAERKRLIDKEAAGDFTEVDRQHLDALQAYSTYRIEKQLKELKVEVR